MSRRVIAVNRNGNLRSMRKTDPLLDAKAFAVHFAHIVVQHDRKVYQKVTGRMPIEIKGLSAVVQRARKSISDVRAKAAGLDADTAALSQTIDEVRKHVNAVHDDLKFEAESLGNSPPDGEEAK